MATFKVGQRVRINIPDPACCGHDSHGKETVILAGPFQVAGYTAYHTELTLRLDRAGIVESALVPLTDPGADEFIARLKKLGSEPAILSPSQLEEVRGA